MLISFNEKFFNPSKSRLKVSPVGTTINNNSSQTTTPKKTRKSSVVLGLASLAALGVAGKIISHRRIRVHDYVENGIRCIDCFRGNELVKKMRYNKDNGALNTIVEYIGSNVAKVSHYKKDGFLYDFIEEYKDNKIIQLTGFQDDGKSISWVADSAKRTIEGYKDDKLFWRVTGLDSKGFPKLVAWDRRGDSVKATYNDSGKLADDFPQEVYEKVNSLLNTVLLNNFKVISIFKK